MGALRLDYEKNTPFPWVGACLAVFVAAMLILFTVYFSSLRNRVHEQESRLERIALKNPARARLSSSIGVGKVDLAQEVKNANDVLHHLSVPWDGLFKAVESSAGSHITLLALEPDFEKKQVKISGEGNSYKTIMKYITELEQRDVLSSVYLQSHDIRQEDPDKPVRFSLLANWQEKP